MFRNYVRKNMTQKAYGNKVNRNRVMVGNTEYQEKLVLCFNTVKLQICIVLVFIVPKRFIKESQQTCDMHKTYLTGC